MENQSTIIVNEVIVNTDTGNDSKKKILKSSNKKEYFHSWYLENREKVIKRVSQYNKEKSEYIICECGKPIQLKNTRHIHTDLHRRWLENKGKPSTSSQSTTTTTTSSQTQTI
jgi:activator of HSP90 ATPase